MSRWRGMLWGLLGRRCPERWFLMRCDLREGHDGLHFVLRHGQEWEWRLPRDGEGGFV